MDRPYYDPEIETISRRALEELQLERLKRQLVRCYERSPFYRERFDRAGFDPYRVKQLSDLTYAPVVTKEELRQEQEAHPPFGRFTVASAESWAEVHPSSGTTGRPVNTIWSHSDVQNIADFTARMMWQIGVRPGDIVQNGFSYGLWVAGMATHYGAQKIGCFIIPIGAQLTERQIMYLTDVGSTVFFATPSYGLHIAERLKQEGIDPQSLALRIGSFGGEGGTQLDSTRRKLEQGLGIDAYDIFGLAEIGPTFAAECQEKAGLHWSEDHHLIEIIDPETMQPCEPGEVGVLVITHLTREATPMIRYWTNDYATLTIEPCACGRTHARSIGGVLGRHDDLIIYRGAKFYPLQVENVIRSFKELGDEYQIHLTRDPQTGVDRCVVKAEVVLSGVQVEPLQRQVQVKLKEACLVTPEVELLPEGSLERTTFKAKRVFDLR